MSTLSKKQRICTFLILVVVLIFIIYKTSTPLGIRFNQFNNFKTRKYVFIDLGANNGDSLLKFFDINALAKAYVGGPLSYKNFGPEAERAQWEVYALEANPTFNSILLVAESEVAKNHTVHIYKETAAWTYDGTIDFYLDTVNGDRNFWGSSLNAKHPDVISSGKKKIIVTCKDVAKIIAKYREEDFVVVKMDIEGAEYDLLLDFLKKNVFSLIDFMAIEFHTGLSKMQSKEDVFMQILTMYGTKFVEWH